jgi:3-methyladenine DNA glycosylase AlkD
MVKTIQAHLELLHDPSRAVAMSAYMRNQFEFLGIPAPLRKAASKQAFTSLGLGKKPLDIDLVQQLWALPEREYQYVAVEYLHNKIKKLELAHFELLEFLIVNKSWWDTVDGLALLVGVLVQRFPSLLERLDTWAEHQNFWLRRVAMIHQLRFKYDTDSSRLFGYALQNATNSEFFIRKAIGWALREYAKIMPRAVQDFIFEHPELSNLTKREALKGLTNHHLS